MRYGFLFLLVWMGGTVCAQFTFQSGKSAGMGQVNAISQDVYSLFGNQAGLAFVPEFSAMAAAERRFMLPELQTVAAGAVLPTRSGTFGLSVLSFGFETFRQQKIGLAYARLLGKNFALGAQFDYLQTRIDEYGSKGALTFEAGMQAVISKKVILGTHLVSPVPVEWTEEERLPTIVRMGLAWMPSDKALVALEFEKDIDFPLRFKGGFEYEIAGPVTLRSGFGINPATFHAGIGIRISEKLQADVAGSYHQVLGFSPAAAVRYGAE